MKKLMILTMTLLTLTLFTGCGNKEVSAEPLDIGKLADSLAEGVTFKDEMSLLDSNMLSAIYTIDEADLVTSKVYVSTGATAEEIAVFEAKDTESADRISTAVDDRIKAQIDGFENYVPEELVKLKKPVIEKQGTYVILCITDDYDKAVSIIKDTMK